MEEEAIRLAARRWIEHHGEAAAAKVREHAACARAAGDSFAADQWLRIIMAIEELRRSR